MSVSRQIFLLNFVQLEFFQDNSKLAGDLETFRSVLRFAEVDRDIKTQRGKAIERLKKVGLFIHKLRTTSGGGAGSSYVWKYSAVGKRTWKWGRGADC